MREAKPNMQFSVYHSYFTVSAYSLLFKVKRWSAAQMVCAFVLSNFSNGVAQIGSLSRRDDYNKFPYYMSR